MSQNSGFVRRSRLLSFWAVWAAVCVLLLILEVLRIQRLRQAGQPVVNALFHWDMECTAASLVFVMLPVLVRAFPNRTSRKLTSRSTASEDGHAVRHNSPSVRMQLTGFLVVALVSFGSSAAVGFRPVTLQTAGGAEVMRFYQLPPAYHDEYSYLLQAKTFACGRLSWPPADIRPDLFHQFHVLNHRRTVSRYFPWTGVWMAPFAALDVPFLGHWLAGALAAGFFFLSLAQWGRMAWAWTGGLLVAISPGLAVFSNLLLAHHPTLLALSVFTWACFRVLRDGRLSDAAIAGCALTAAMLGRPMTAAGFGLPFGLWMLLRLWKGSLPWKIVSGFAIPLVIGFLALAGMNLDATGSFNRSAYQEYTDLFTPRHRYGFNNAADRPELTENQQRTSDPVVVPEALKKYDSWAHNLTFSMAAKNVWSRLVASLVWSLGIAPIVFFIGLLPANLFRKHDDVQPGHMVPEALLLLAVCSLHLVHVPYWFDGIQHWHYVFETAPLLLLLSGAGIVECFRILSVMLRRGLAVGWIAAVLLCSLIPDWVELPVFGDVSKVSAAVSELSFSRTRMAQFQRLLTDPQVQKPALILVDESGTDPQLSYIINPPNYEGPILVCRLPQTASEVNDLQKAFSERTLYIFSPETFRLTRHAKGEGGQ